MFLLGDNVNTSSKNNSHNKYSCLVPITKLLFAKLTDIYIKLPPPPTYTLYYIIKSVIKPTTWEKQVILFEVTSRSNLDKQYFKNNEYIVCFFNSMYLKTTFVDKTEKSLSKKPIMFKSEKKNFIFKLKKLCTLPLIHT